MWILLIFANLILTTIAQIDDNDLWVTYTKCRDTLGKPNWLCDPNNVVYHQTAKEINDLLWRMQAEVPCYCRFTNDCFRFGDMQIQSGVVGAMILTPRMPDNVDATAKRIYQDARLASANCSNGLLIVYAYEAPQNIYTFRGELTEQTLNSANAMKIMNDTLVDIKGGKDDKYTLTELIKQYTSWLKGQTFDRQRTWEAMVGMVVGVVIAAFAAAAAIGIFFAYCCCKKRKKQQRPSPAPPIQAKSMGALKAPPPKKITKALLTKSLVNRMKTNKQKMLTTKSGKKITPKRLVKAHNRHQAKGASHDPRSAPQGSPPMMHQQYPSFEEPYYVISEPSTMYSTLPRDSPVEGQQQRGYPYGRPPYPLSGTPTITYPESTVSEAYLIPRSRSPLPPEQETQRKDIFVNDEDETKTADTFKTAPSTVTYRSVDTMPKIDTMPKK